MLQSLLKYSILIEDHIDTLIEFILTNYYIISYITNNENNDFIVNSLYYYGKVKK